MTSRMDGAVIRGVVDEARVDVGAIAMVDVTAGARSTVGTEMGRIA